MRKIIVISLFVFSLGSSYFAQDTVYRDEKYRFSLSYGASWKVTTSSQPLIRFKLAQQTDETFADFSILVNTAPKKLQNWTSEQYATETIKLKSTIEEMVLLANPTGKLVASGDTYVNNKKAVFSKSTATLRSLDDELDITIYQVFLLYQGNIYVITLRASTPIYDEAFKDFRVLVQSLVIRPKELERVLRSK